NVVNIEGWSSGKHGSNLVERIASDFRLVARIRIKQVSAHTKTPLVTYGITPIHANRGLKISPSVLRFELLDAEGIVQMNLAPFIKFGQFPLGEVRCLPVGDVCYGYTQGQQVNALIGLPNRTIGKVMK